MKIFTSIAPRKTDTQRLAIESWIENGFQPVSMNSAAEIERLAPLFPEVKFIRAHRDATELAGKPLIYIDDLLEAMRPAATKSVAWSIPTSFSGVTETCPSGSTTLRSTAWYMVHAWTLINPETRRVKFTRSDLTIFSWMR